MTSTVAVTTVKKSPLTAAPVQKPSFGVGNRVQARTGNTIGTVEAVRLAGTEIMVQILWENGKKGAVPEKMLKKVEPLAVVPKQVPVRAQDTGKRIEIVPQAPKPDPKTVALERQLSQTQTQVKRLEAEIQGFRKGGNGMQLSELQYLKKQISGLKTSLATSENKRLNLSLALEALGVTSGGVMSIEEGQGLPVDEFDTKNTALEVLVKK